MSKITNDCLTRSGTAVPHMATVGVKGLVEKSNVDTEAMTRLDVHRCSSSPAITSTEFATGSALTHRPSLFLA